MGKIRSISVTLAYFIAEYIFPEEYDGNPLNEKDAAIFEVMKSEIKTELQIDALNFIQKNNKKQLMMKKKSMQMYFLKNYMMLCGIISEQ